ncbi:hypothetical protein ACFY6U_06960 [Streptomyces sp. NPDC013157]|uniref:hypothetical protein n=1 Tax=Streptomyces sp. NPDC013157 TaxID=3364861 RepID=UPI00369A623A
MTAPPGVLVAGAPAHRPTNARAPPRPSNRAGSGCRAGSPPPGRFAAADAEHAIAHGRHAIALTHADEVAQVEET